MSEKKNFPSKVIIQANNSLAAGLAVCLRFHMDIKNDYNYIVFLDVNGRAEVSQEELLELFDKERNYFIMDYSNPRTSFTGEISVEILNDSDILNALKIYQLYKKRLVYPDEYENRMGMALPKSHDISSFTVGIEVVP